MDGQQKSTLTLERNISVFDGDAQRHGGYVYTSVEKWSSQVATARQTDALVQMLRAHFSSSAHITDVGCGDGSLTLDLDSPVEAVVRPRCGSSC
jgi:hypothetical protein